MTCIVALKDKEKGVTLLGADSCVTDGYVSANLPRAGKLTKVNGFVMGTAGSVAAVNVIDLCKDLFIEVSMKEPFNLHDLLLQMVPSIKKFGNEMGYIGEDEEKINYFPGESIITVADQICIIACDLSVTSLEEDYYSIGSGQPFALGSLYSIVGMDPRKRVLMALGAAASRDAGVKPPFSIIKSRPFLKNIARKKAST